ncbi:MAG: hypothetical protein AAF632_20620 [Bacteroidota bacterium]
MEQLIAVDFQTHDESTVKDIKDQFSEHDVIESDAFSGTEIVTVLITTSAVVLDKVLNYFAKNRKTLKETTLKVKSKEIELSGFTNTEIQQMISNGSLEALMKLTAE